MLVTKNSYGELVRPFARALQTIRRGTETPTEQLSEREAMFSELDLKVQLLAEKDKCTGDLQNLLDEKIVEPGQIERDLDSKKSAVKQKSRCSGRLEVELRADQAEMGRKERVVHNFLERFCNWVLQEVPFSRFNAFHFWK